MDAAPSTCPACGHDPFDEPGYYGLDGTTDAQGVTHVHWMPCCQWRAEDVQDRGFEASYEKPLGQAVGELVGYDAQLADDGLVVGLPERVSPARSKGDGRYTSPKGWQARVFEHVDEHHRHHDRPQGWKFGVALDRGRTRIGVATVGRPVSRMLASQFPGALEVTRVALADVPKDLRTNAISMLYGEVARKAREGGYDRIITYTMEDESGDSLRAAGFVPTHRSRGGGWSRESRPREDGGKVDLTGAKVRWERGLTRSAKREVKERAAAFDAEPMQREERRADAIESVIAARLDRLETRLQRIPGMEWPRMAALLEEAYAAMREQFTKAGHVDP